MDFLLDQFNTLTQLSGVAGGIATLVFGLIRLYRFPDFQEYIPTRVQWDNLHKLARYGMIGALAGIGSMIASLSNGLTWKRALVSAFMGAVGAIVSNKVTQTDAARAVAAVVVPPAGGKPNG